MTDTKTEELILKAMKSAGKPVRPGDIIILTNLPKDQVSKTIKQLKTKGLIHSPKRCFYAVS